MPRIHFHFSDGFSDPDSEGHEFPDLVTARVAAAQFLGQTLRDKAGDFWADGEWVLTATDDSQLVLFTVRLSALDAPALRATVAPVAPAGA